MRRFFYADLRGFPAGSLLNILIGLLLVLFKGSLLGFAGQLVGGIFALVGVLFLVTRFRLGGGRLSLGGGLFFLLLGLYLIRRPQIVASIIPVICGLLLLQGGLRSLLGTLSAPHCRGLSWLIRVVPAAVSIGFGVVCITDAFGIMERALQFVGIIMILYGLYNLYLSGKKPQFKNQAPGGGDDYIDVTFR